MIKLELALYVRLELGHAERLVICDNTADPSESLKCLADDGHRGLLGRAHFREPVVDTAVDGVEGRVRAVDRYAGGSTAQEAALARVREREGRDRFENRWVVRDDAACRGGESFFGDFCRQAGGWRGLSVGRAHA